MDYDSDSCPTSANAGGTRTVAKVAAFVCWSAVAVIATYSVLLIGLSLYGIHIVKGV